jgi:hypothetical protein
MAVYYVNHNKADQGAARTSDDFVCGPESLKEIVDHIGTTNKAKIVCQSSSVAQTDYTLTTSLTITSNITLEVEPGAVFDGAGTLTINGGLDVLPGQYWIGSSITIEGSPQIDIVYPQWWMSSWDGDLGQDDTTPLQSAITFAGQASPSGSTKSMVVKLMAGRYKITAPLTVADNTGVHIVGESPTSSTIYQDTSETDVIRVHYTALANGNSPGSIQNLRIQCADVGTSGVGISLKNVNDNFYVKNVDIYNVGTGILFHQVWNCYFNDIRIIYFTDVGIKWEVADTDHSAGNFLSNFKISNNGYTALGGDNSDTICVFIQQNNGDYLSHFTVGKAFQGIYIQPAASEYVYFMSFDTVFSDANSGENWIFDGSLGDIKAITLNNCWGAFSTNEEGILFTGANIDGVHMTGCRFRENGKFGVNISGGKNITLNDCHIATNSKLTTNTYAGVYVAADIDEWSVTNCRIGNYASDLAHTQADNINIVAGTSTNFRIIGNDLRDPGSGKESINNNSTGSGYKIENNIIEESVVVASATTVTLPESGNYFNISGTTAITSVTTSWAGRIVTLKFQDVVTFTDGSNLKLAGNFVTTADDVITLVCDGTNWVEMSRSIN